MSGLVIVLVLVGIFLLAGALIALGLGLSRRGGTAAPPAPTAPPAPRPPAPPTPPPAPEVEVEAPPAEPVAPPEPVAPREKVRLRDRLGKTRAAFAGYLGSLTGRGAIDDDTWDELEEALLLADVGVPTTTRLLDDLRERAAAAKVTDPGALVDLLRDEIVDDLADADRALHDGTDKPTVWLFVGVNGVGKTTTIAKLAQREIGDGRQVVLAASDTFRAAAADQLAHWGDRVGATVVRGQEGADPGSVVFDAMSAAAGRDADLLLVDTAGRMHTKVNLMQELEKIRRIIDRRPGALQEVLLVLDATTGQNGLVQAAQFAESVGVTGVVLTKLDGTAKGGIVLAIEADLGIPVKLVGVGESPDDLVAFDPTEFADALFGD
jgi:fused signal recognition particle receptor